MILDRDGNVIVGGSSEENGESRFTTIKYSNAGEEIWVQHYRGPNDTSSEIQSIDTDPLGNIYVGGNSNAFYPREGESEADFATIKYAPDGTQLWVARYDGPARGKDEVHAISVDPQGNCVVSGTSAGVGTDQDIAVVKYDADGQELWARRYTSTGAGDDEGSETAVDESGNVYVAGFIAASGGSDSILLKYDPNGTLLWLRTYDGPAGREDRSHVLAVNRDGYAHLVSDSQNANGDTDIVTLRYAPDGTLLWEKRYNGTGNGDDFGYSVALDRIGNVYVAGESQGSGTGSDIVVLKYDANGNEMWVRRYDGPGGGRDVPGSFEPLFVDAALNVYATGVSSRALTEASEDYVTIKFAQPAADDSGFEVLHDFDGPDGSQPGGLFLAADGILYGVTAAGGADDLGAIFGLESNGRFKNLFSFLQTDIAGETPSLNGLTELNGSLYGTTSGNGVNLPGTVFKITPDGSFTLLDTFAFSGIEGVNPNGGLTLGDDGNFYGTTQEGGANGGGTFFRVTPSGNIVKLLDFDSAKGTRPMGQLLKLDDGSFLGTTRVGGGSNGGTIYRVTTAGEFSLLHEFQISTGAAPESGLVRAAGGRYFGVTTSGGQIAGGAAGGVFYEITLGGTYAPIFNFNPLSGSVPAAAPLAASDGTFYGVTREGGPENLGVIYRLTTAGDYSVLHFFSDVAGDVLYPNASLIEGGDGRLYGTTQAGGSDFGGFVFRLPIPPSPTATPEERGLRASQAVSAPPAFDGSLTVNLSSSANAGQWRLAGELTWHDSGTQITGLATGDYVVEFRPVDGRSPDPELVHVEGPSIPPIFVYPTTGALLSGGVSVIIKPDYLATAKDEARRGQWRRVGEPAYHNTGDTVTLPIGVHLIEFKGVAGRRTPLTASVLVEADSISEFTATYFPQPTLNGLQPVELSVADATTHEPYAFCGQILSDAGTATGFAVADRVVLTAGHVVFDESSLSFTGGIRWLFQRMRGDVEPVPMEPRGAYLLDGYAAARQKPGVVPGESTVESQQADMGAIYFNTSAARGGFSGYLVSNSAYEWLGKAGQKTIVGYPTEIVPQEGRGRMFATPLQMVNFTRVAAPPGTSSQVWRTQEIGGLPGISGGPLFAEFDGGGLYPAGVFLGGNGEALVRAIDEQVELMILNAAISASTGQHNNNGGSLQVNARISASSFTLGALTVNLAPSAGTGWRLIEATPRDYQASGTTRTGLKLGTYSVEFADRAGFLRPAKQTVTLDGADAKTLSATYLPLPPAVITLDPTLLVCPGLVVNTAITASNDPTGFTLQGALPTGLTFNGTAIFGTMPGDAALGDFHVSLRATNAAGVGPQFNLTVRVVPAGMLKVEVNNAAGGNVTGAVTGPVPVGKTVRLIAHPVPGFLFTGWTGSFPAPTAKLAFKMEPLTNVTANFIVNPFTSTAGNYSGLMGAVPAEFSKAGKITLDLTSTGAFTAALQVGKVKKAFPGQI